MGSVKRRRGRVLLVAGIALLVAIGSATAYRVMKGRQTTPPAAVAFEFTRGDLAQVEMRPLARWLPISGALQPVKLATVKSKSSGDVISIAVREGQSVKAGDVLARIDTSDLEARLAERAGALEAARAQLALAEKTRDVNMKLLKQNFISQNAADNTESSYTVAKGQVKSAEAQVQLARNAMRDSVVVAPISGIVAKRHVQPGEKVAFDSPIVTVVDLRELELQALVPAVDVPELSVGMPVELAVDGFDRRFAGRIERISPATEPGTRSLVVYVGLSNAENALKSGMFASGRIALSSSMPAPTLPLTAVRNDAGQTYIWVIRENKLVRRAVVTGRRDDEAGVIEIKTALTPDTPVLAARFDNLKEGAPAIVRAPTPSNSRSG
ncbi:MAG: efflux RND transporter periplasmic adaptor subunit [Pseudomonadota bacterium]|nr:efflux RND transporter periplasmic adaptor subunit [Pseudomonadota bacterium]